MRGEATPVQIAALLMGLRAKGETADEVAGAARALRARDGPARGRRTSMRLVDTCGTGGGRVGTFNISTAAAFVVAGAGVRGGQARQPQLHLALGLGRRARGAGRRHPAAARAGAGGAATRRASSSCSRRPITPPCGTSAPVRKELGVATIMNLLGPLANPGRRAAAGGRRRGRGPRAARRRGAGARSGAEHALVVHAAVGMDEISPLGPTRVWEVRDGEVDRVGASTPDAFGLDCDDLDGLAGRRAGGEREPIERLLGRRRHVVERCAVLLNAAAALYVAGRGWTMARRLERARAALETGCGAGAGGAASAAREEAASTAGAAQG